MIGKYNTYNKNSNNKMKTVKQLVKTWRTLYSWKYLYAASLILHVHIYEINLMSNLFICFDDI